MTSAELRYLPAARPGWEWEADVVVVGSGAAGMSAALAAAGHGRQVLLVSKDGLGDGSTPLAQGGLAAAVGDGDSTRLHERDTLAAGAGLCDPVAVADLVAGAPAEIVRLVRLGARLDSTELHLEGGHSRPRIVRAGGDAAGAEVHRVLSAALRRSPVEIVTHCAALDLMTDELGQAAGLLLGLTTDGQPRGRRGQVLSTGLVRASAVVLATGGFGQVFGTTTNPPGLTGDGLALAARAGAELRDLEFVQFHPTVLWQEAAPGQRPLITEALRGAGAVLVDAAGQRIMDGRHPLGDLAPRDVVSAAVAERLNGQRHVWLDATRLGRAALERDFPTVTAACRAAGIDPAAEPIPVVPGAHYACGGIRAGLDGRTSVPGLYAVGEAAATGVHGANRLASNSLTESLLAGHRAGDRLGHALPRPGAVLVPPPAGTGVSPAAVPALTSATSAHAGVMRDPGELASLLAVAARAPAADGGLDLATVEATSLHTVAVLVAVAALARAESRGCHRWRDVPPTKAGRGSPSVWRCDGGQVRPAAADRARAGAVA